MSARKVTHEDLDRLEVSVDRMEQVLGRLTEAVDARLEREQAARRR